MTTPLVFLVDGAAPWMAPNAPTAVCAEVDPELWHPEKGASTLAPKRLCGSCPLVAACLDWALAHPSQTRFGVWGGTSERERRALLRQRRAVTATAGAGDELAEVA